MTGTAFSLIAQARRLAAGVKVYLRTKTMEGMAQYGERERPELQYGERERPELQYGERERPESPRMACSGRRGSLTLPILRRVSFLLILLAALLPSPALQAQAEQDVIPLEPGKAAVERELAGGQSHAYQITLAAGQYLLVIVDQKGVDVVVLLFDPEGKELTRVDSPNGAYGAERLAVVVETAGNYRIEMRSLEKKAPAGKYAARIAELRVATAEDRVRNTPRSPSRSITSP
jgi:hypothetical protein